MWQCYGGGGGGGDGGSGGDGGGGDGDGGDNVGKYGESGGDNVGNYGESGSGKGPVVMAAWQWWQCFGGSSDNVDECDDDGIVVYGPVIRVVFVVMLLTAAVL